MTLEELQKEWEIDAKIDSTILQQHLEDTPQLIQKWGGRYSYAERKVLNKLRKERRYLKIALEEAYTGVMPQKQIIEDGIEVNVPHGLKLKRDSALCEEYIKINPKLEAMDERIQEQEFKVELIERAINALRDRNFNLQKLVDMERWSEGFN